jgi:hypothetical protein
MMILIFTKAQKTAGKIIWITTSFLLFLSINLKAQNVPKIEDVNEERTVDDFEFSGTINLGSNGIAIIPAFALRRPGLASFLTLQKGRFIYRPQFGFGIEGSPWFFNNCLIYESVKTEKFTLGTGLIWGVGFKRPEIVHNGVLQKVAVGERFLWLELTPEYRFRKNLTLSSRVWYGNNFEEGSADRILFTSVKLNINKIKLIKPIYLNLQPQLFYLGLDHEQHGLFMFSTVQLGIDEIPVVLTAQINTPFTHSIEPSPVTLWNFGLTFEF